MNRLFTIRDGTWDGHRKTLAELPEALHGMQADIRKRCTVVEWIEGEVVPADEMLERLRRAARAEMVTIPPVDAERDTLPPDAVDGTEGVFGA